jgi:hypothetical protein
MSEPMIYDCKTETKGEIFASIPTQTQHSENKTEEFYDPINLVSGPKTITNINPISRCFATFYACLNVFYDEKKKFTQTLRNAPQSSSSNEISAIVVIVLK